MAGAAKIGSIHVSLGLDSAEFQAGLKKANSGLDKFAKAAKVGFAVVAAAAVAAGGALAFAIKGAIDNADEMSKTAQKVGVTTEALSRLNYAAGLSDVTLQQLSTGLGRLTQSMSQIAQGAAGPAKMAFDALGISALTATGQLRSSDDVLADVAEKFASMEDGATKTALAIALFGRSGADLIPMLNMGKAGLSALATEADRLGITLSTSAGRSAEAFNDSLTRLQSVFTGIINRIMTAVLPALDEFSDKISDPAFAESAEAIGLAIVDAMKLAVDAINTVVGAFTALRDAMSWANSHDMFGNDIAGNGGGKGFQKFNTPEEAKAILAEKLAAGDTGGPSASFFKGIFGEVAAEAQEVAAAFEPVIQNTKAAGAAASELKAIMAEGQSVFTSTRTPAEAYSLEIARLNGLLQKGAIDQDTYNRAVGQAQDAFQAAEASGKQWVSSLADSLSGLFGSILDGSKTAMEAVNDLIKSFAQMALQAGFKMLLGGIFGGGGGGGFLGIPGFANGTNNAPGGLAMVGERGPELVNLPRGSQVIPNKDLGTGQLDVRISLDSAMLNAVVTDGAGRVVGQAAPAIVGAAVSQSNKAAPGAMARYQQQQAGSDWRL